MRANRFKIATVLSLLLLIAAVSLRALGKDFYFTRTTDSAAPKKYSAGFDGRSFVYVLEDAPTEQQIAAALALYNTTVQYPNHRDPYHRSEVWVKQWGVTPDPGIDLGLLVVGYSEFYLTAWAANSFDFPMTSVGQYRVVEISPWLPVVVFAILPVVAACRFIQRRRHPPEGFCRACGYNLTGNTSGICPECGGACNPARDAAR